MLRCTWLVLVICACDYSALPKLSSTDGAMGDGSGIEIDAPPGSPAISAVVVGPRVGPGAPVNVDCQASDPDGDSLTYTWTFSGGTSTGTGATVSWTPPATEGPATVMCSVSDGNLTDTETKNVQVLVTNGLIAGYFLTGDGKDFSGTGHDITLPGNLSFVADRFGQVGNAVHFNGVNTVLTVPTESDFDLTTISIVTFIKPIAFTNHRGVVGKGTANGGGAFSIRIQEDDATAYPGYAQFMWAIGAGGYSEFSTSAIPTTQYSSLVAVRTSTDAKLYVAGALVTSQTHAGTVDMTNDPVTIGKDGVTIPGYFYGEIDEVRFYNRALTAAEISAINNGVAVE